MSEPPARTPEAPRRCGSRLPSFVSACLMPVTASFSRSPSRRRPLCAAITNRGTRASRAVRYTAVPSAVSFVTVGIRMVYTP